MSDPRRLSFDWTLWVQWLLVTALGWVLGGVLLPGLALVTAGLVIGVLQWVVLRGRLPEAGWWILASTVGWAGGWAIVITQVPPELGFLTGAVLGAAMGTTQWLYLRLHFHRAAWWLPVSTLGWIAGLTLLTGPLLVGAVAGAVTGIALELLFRFPALTKT
jgi:hypothetical protein